MHKEVRDKLGIKPGDVLEEEVEQDRVVLRLSAVPSAALRGIGKRTRRKLGLEATELVRKMR